MASRVSIFHHFTSIRRVFEGSKFFHPHPLGRLEGVVFSYGPYNCPFWLLRRVLLQLRWVPCKYQFDTLWPSLVRKVIRLKLIGEQLNFVIFCSVEGAVFPCKNGKLGITLPKTVVRNFSHLVMMLVFAVWFCEYCI